MGNGGTYLTLLFLVLPNVCSFSDETPSRFRKYIIKAVEEPDHETFQIDRINTLLDNIGRSDARLSSEEIEMLLKEAGVIGGSHYVPTSKLAQLM
jgi:hypothetical protein